MKQIFLFIGIKVVTYRMRPLWSLSLSKANTALRQAQRPIRSVSESKFRVQFKNPTFTRKAGKNNIKIMKKIRRLIYISNADCFKIL